MPRRLLAAAAAACVLAGLAAAHEHHEDGDVPACGGAGAAGRVLASFRPGTISVDGHADDWDGVDATEMKLVPALDPDDDKAYPGGNVAIRAAHDGSNFYFMLHVDGEYAYTKGENTKCPSVALMFQIGENASYYNMGGCKDMPGTCTSESCRGHEVDIMHFSIGSAIPGRLYGGNFKDNSEGNGGDRFGHLVDVYAWNPHCRFLDGIGTKGNNSNAQNDWHGSWWHSSLMSHSGYIHMDSPFGQQGQKGTYYFEFSRPLRTMDEFQQDTQFSIGGQSKMAVAFWYPSGGKPWSRSDHYSASCDWLTLDVESALHSQSYPAASRPWSAASAFALLLSILSLCIAAFAALWASRNRGVPFTPIVEMSR